MGEMQDWILWKSEFETGYKPVDEQHKELVKILNDLYRSSLDRESDIKESFKEAIKKTIDYASYHFAYEEKIMRAVKYEKAMSHMAKHRIFSQEILKQVSLYEQGSRFVANQFVRFLRDWLLNHIAVEDKEFIKTVKEILKKMSSSDTADK